MIGDKHGVPQQQQYRQGGQRGPGQGQGQPQGQGGQGDGRRRRRRRRGRGGERDRFQQGQPGQQQPGYRPQGQQQRAPQQPGAVAVAPAAPVEGGAVPAAADAARVSPVGSEAAALAPASPAAEGAPVSAPTQQLNVEIPGTPQVVAQAPVAPQHAPQVGQQQPGRQQHHRRDRENGHQPPPNVRKVVLMNASDPGEIRVAILENGELAEIFMERKSRGQQAGNIYKGRVVNVEPSLQAAFVDLGTERNGFLHASDCIPPDGGYGDILTKPAPRTEQQQQRGRDRERGERHHDPRRGQSYHQQQQQRRAQQNLQQPTPAASSAPAAAPESAAAAQGPTSTEARSEEEVKVLLPGQPVTDAQPSAPPAREALPEHAAPAAPAAESSNADFDSDDTDDGDSDDDAPDNELEAPVSAGEAQPQPGQQGQRPPHAHNSQNGGRRRRRRRGGRGRSGRGRPPGPAPMMAPNHSNSDPEAPRDAQHGQNDPAPQSAPVAPVDAAPTTVPAETRTLNDEPHAAPPAPEAPAAPASQAEPPLPPEAAPAQPAETGEAQRAEPAAEIPLVPASHETQASDASSENVKAASSEPVEVEGETEIDTDNVPPAPAEGEQANGATEWQEHPVAEEVQATEIVVPEQRPQTSNAREAAPIPAPGQPAPQLAQPRQGGGRSGRERPHDRRYTIQEMLREGQEVLIQVAKEGIGQKGPALTTYLSMPGRYLVLMPAVQRLGVSKRIENEEQRRALKDALSQLNPPDDMGVIVRTAGTGRGKEELQRDMDYLVRVWETLKKKAKVAKAPALVYQEGDVVTRVFRDVITDDVAEIIIDDPVVAERAREFLRETAPGTEGKVRLYSDAEPLFHKQGVEQQLQRLFNRKVNLRSGGSIVIEQTEALVAIDVNTGRFREKRSQDDTILATNLEAAREVARQLRLRDIGGLVMIDFIDMEIHEHRRRVERELKAHLARDKARINVLPISSLGIVEMTRQRIRHSLRKTLFDRCPHCSGSGHVKSAESLGLDMLREVKGQLRDGSIKRVLVRLNSMVAFDILNHFRKDLARLEEARGITIEVRGDGAVPLSQIQVSTAKEGGEWVLKKISEVDDYVRNS